MTPITVKAVALAFAISLISSVAIAAQKDSMQGHGNMDHSTMDHSTMDHSKMNHAEMDHSKMNHKMEKHNTQAMGVGVIHRVSRLNRMVNLTHEPIAALNWPEMTMDLAVAKSVDLSTIKTGEKVKFHLELGKDKKYVITHIMK